ncbi:MAG: helix-turn-helix transcriptional regulator [Clostridia bacterium]|nr:helix-turn-helix transcriptional regulator [Clostridia bacterium]
MNIKIGSIIKKLRTENGITQDMLATAIGVTPQAISRWESESGYPDIEHLPVIADFFAISIDELLGYKISEREKRLADIKGELRRLTEVGIIEKRIDFLRIALAQYPSDCELKEKLAASLSCLYFDRNDNAVLPEAESLALYVVENCRDEDTRYGAISTLVSIYADTDRPDKAIEMINLLTPMKYCREFLKSQGIGDGKTEIYKQDEIDKLTDCLGIAVRNLVLDDELPNDPSTWDKKIRMIEISNELYHMIYGENLMFYHCRLAFNYWIMSTYQISQGKIEETLFSLEKMCNHATAYDKSYENDHGKHFTSILTDKLVYPEPSKDFHELKEHSQSYYMLGKLNNKRYDCIRDNDRFQNIIEALKKHAR